MTIYVAYVRVSTDKQGRSGLGLEAQRAAIDAFLKPGDKLLQPPYVEQESGRKAARPVLAKAIQRCRKTGATLLVAKMDRLSRDVDFLRTLIRGDVDVVFGDLPHVPNGAMGRFLLTQMASVAELEAGLISERTKAALAAAKSRGIKLGGDRGYRPAGVPAAFADGPGASVEARMRKADRAAFAVTETIEGLRAEGITSLNGLAGALNERGVATPRGGQWTATAVRRALARAEDDPTREAA